MVITIRTGTQFTVKRCISLIKINNWEESRSTSGRIFQISCKKCHLRLISKFKTSKAYRSKLKSSKLTSFKNKNPVTLSNGVLSIQSGDALLSHGEAPHYHRHYSILLLSSVWSQVELLHYGRRNIRS